MGGTSIARSLRLSLLAATISVAAIAVLASAWVTNRETKRELVGAVGADLAKADEITVRFKLRAQDFASAGGDPWGKDPGRSGPGAVGIDEFVADVAHSSGLRVIVRTNTDGVLLADSEGKGGAASPPGSVRTVSPPPESAETQLNRLRDYWDAMKECYQANSLPFDMENDSELGFPKPIIRLSPDKAAQTDEQAIARAARVERLAGECRNDNSGRLQATPPFEAVDVFIAQPDVAARVAEVDGITQRLAATIVGVLILTIAITGLIARKILRPIGTLTAAAQVMARGDLSHRVQLRRSDEIGQLADTFDAMATSLEDSALQRKRMTSDIAHELRTPLSNIRGYLEAAQDGVTQLTPALVASLLEDTLLLQSLVEDLQELAVAESGQLQLQRSPTDIDELAQSVAAAHRARALQSGIAIEIDTQSGAQADLDVRRVRQVLTNLVENAIRHTDAGGEIRVTTRLSTQPGERGTVDFVEVAVADNGTGIAPEHLPHIFDRFYRADASRNRATGGSGLGLAITRELVTAHGGTIAVTSTPGAGTCFVVRLPLVAPTPTRSNGFADEASVYSARG